MVFRGRPTIWRSVSASILGTVLAIGTGLCTGLTPIIASARAPQETVAAVSLASLPAQAQHTHQLILAGGPFPHDKDGTVFGNREQSLPREPRGYYREYTVPTPGSRDRGARRIVCGGHVPRTPDVCYYTQDQYASFRRIAP